MRRGCDRRVKLALSLVPTYGVDELLILILLNVLFAGYEEPAQLANDRCSVRCFWKVVLQFHIQQIVARSSRVELHMAKVVSNQP